MLHRNVLGRTVRAPCLDDRTYRMYVIPSPCWWWLVKLFPSTAQYRDRITVWGVVITGVVNWVTGLSDVPGNLVAYRITDARFYRACAI